MSALPWLGAYLLSSHQVPGSFLYPHSSCQPLCNRSSIEDAQFNPVKRIASEEILYHPYPQAWHDPVDEPTHPAKFCFSPEDEDSIEGMKNLVDEEVHLFWVEIGAHARAAERVCCRDEWTSFEFPSHAPGFDNTFCILRFTDPPSRKFELPDGWKSQSDF